MPQAIFAAVNPRIFSGAFLDSLHKRDCLADAHIAAAIMIVHFEIENEQNAGTVFLFVRSRIHQRMRRGDDRQKVVGLLNRIGAVREMIRAPQQTGPHRLSLPFGVTRVALVFWKTGFVNHADNAFASHRDKVYPHQIVMGQVHDAVAGERAERAEQSGKKSSKLHSRKIAGEIRNANFETLNLLSDL